MYVPAKSTRFLVLLQSKRSSKTRPFSASQTKKKKNNRFTPKRLPCFGTVFLLHLFLSRPVSKIRSRVACFINFHRLRTRCLLTKSFKLVAFTSSSLFMTSASTWDFFLYIYTTFQWLRLSSIMVACPLSKEKREKLGVHQSSSLPIQIWRGSL